MSGTRAAVTMSAASSVALLAAIGGYLVYSRILTPAEFGLYAGALAIARFGTMLLDGGLKLALIRQGGSLGDAGYRGAFWGSALLASGGLVVLIAVLAVLVATDVIAQGTAVFVGAYACAYFVSYPWLVIPSADLERSMRFGAVARAEGLTISIEYLLPALLWLAVRPGFWAFVASVWLARVLRAALLLASSGNRAWLRAGPLDWKQTVALFTVGFGLQVGSLASTLRDSLHIVLIGPIFGRDMVGLYAWALQLCGMASQVFVQTASRVSLPVLLGAASDDDRWKKTMVQIKWLTVLTFPPLLCLRYLAPAANHAFFADKWTGALALLPFLIWRTLPGLAIAPLGANLIAQQGARGYLWANASWTVAELLAAAALIAWIGSAGLAWSYSFIAWFGLALFASRLRHLSAIGDILRVLLLRPSLWVAAVLTFPYGFVPASISNDFPKAVVLTVIVCALSMASEPCVRELLRKVATARVA